MPSYIRKHNRRATTDAGIEDNWVELPSPELALATSLPAVSIPGGQLGVQFGRMGVTLSNAVPHGIPNVSGLRHGQMTRRVSISSSASSGWPGFMVPERKEPRTHSAFAVVNNVVSAFALSPNCGSPPLRSRTISLHRGTPPKMWTTLLPRDEIEEEDLAGQGDSEPFEEDEHPCPSLSSDDSEPPVSPRRANTCPVPSSHNQHIATDAPQYVVFDPRAVIYESPIPLTSGVESARDINEHDETRSDTILDGLDDLVAVVDRNFSQDGYATKSSSTDPYLMLDRHDDFPQSIYPDSMDEYHTPMSSAFSYEFPRESWHTTNPRERKLLIIGSCYDSMSASCGYGSDLQSLKGAAYDTKSLKSAFKKRSYTVQSMVGENFDRDEILDTVAEFLRPAKQGDVRAIIFTGHARRISEETVAIVPPVCHHEKELIPADLWEQTVRENTQPGVIVLSIFASCMSGDLMHQKIDLKDLSDPTPSEDIAPPDVPVFVTFASSRANQLSYESTVGIKEDGSFRPGDHFLRALTLTARDPEVVDWQGFVNTLEDKFAQVRRIGAVCAEHSPVSDKLWLERSPQETVLSASQSRLSLFQSVFPSEISLIERPTTPLPRQTDLAEEFLSHIALHGESLVITHFTHSLSNDGVSLLRS